MRTTSPISVRRPRVGGAAGPGEAAGGAVREWRPKGEPEQVKVHDFVIPEQGKAIPQGVRVTDEQMQSINLSRHEFHGDWNYTIRPPAPINVSFIE